MEQQPLHVLLIEDDDVHAMMVEKAFRSADSQATIDRVADGLDAVAYLTQQGEYQHRVLPRVILLDLNLPRMDGRGVLKMLKADDRLKTIPVVVLTTSDADKDVSEAYHLHANSYLVKPVNFARFRQLITAVATYWGSWNRPLLPSPTSPSPG